MANVMLTPIQELPPGRVSEIRNKAIAQVVALAAKELSLSPGDLLVRDIRPYEDLRFGYNTDYIAELPAVSLDVWGTFKSTNAYIATAALDSNVYQDAIPDGKTMDDQRYVCIYGVRDMRISVLGTSHGLPDIIDQEVALIKFDIGTSDRAIWDLSKCESYKNAIVGVSPQPLLIPPLTPYQISCKLITGGVKPYLQLMGFVVEPVGLLITPIGAGGAAPVQTQLIPTAELAPGAVSAIRDTIISQLIALAATELKKSPDDLIVRDIRPYSDLYWATHADIGVAALGVDRWDFESDDSVNYHAFTEMILSGKDVMADGRFVALYGVKDLRMAQEVPVAQALSELKLHVGGNDRVIWDLQNMQAYPNQLSSICPSAIIIPQRTSYQIYGYGGLSDDGASDDIYSWIMLEGVVVESRGLVISP